MFDVVEYDTFENVKSNCYIAKKIGEKFDDYGNSIPIYEKPNTIPYKFNIQPVDRNKENMDFGETVNGMKVATIIGYEKDKYLNMFNEYDLAYLDGATPNGEAINGDNANYKIYAIRPQNVVLKIYFEKII